MKIMAIDLGDARTGVAISDPSGFLASPLTVIHEKDPAALLEKVAALALEHKPGQIVIGYPKHMSGDTGDRAKGAETFAENLSKTSGIKTVLWDERCTTVMAHQALNQTNTRGKKRKNIIDAVAATIILQDYLDYLKNAEK